MRAAQAGSGSESWPVLLSRLRNRAANRRQDRAAFRGGAAKSLGVVFACRFRGLRLRSALSDDLLRGDDRQAGEAEMTGVEGQYMGQAMRQGRRRDPRVVDAKAGRAGRAY